MKTVEEKLKDHHTWAGAKQPLRRFLGGRAVVIQQGTNVWVG
jgi:lipoate-protein ligase A